MPPQNQFTATLHGGPADGQRILVPDPPPEEWRVPHMAPMPASVAEYADPTEVETRIDAANYRLVMHVRPPEPHRTQDPSLSATHYRYEGPEPEPPRQCPACGSTALADVMSWGRKDPEFTACSDCVTTFTLP